MPVRRFFGLVTALVAFLSLPAPTALGAPPSAAPPQIWAHRGGVVAGVDENTLAAFARARADGAYGVETDIRWTKDGHMVVLHDSTLDRTTDCTGKVSAHSYKYVKTCRTATGQQVPTFNALLEYLATTDLGLMAEVKPSSISSKRAKQYVTAIRHFDMTSRTMALAFHSQPLRQLHKADPKLTRAISAQDKNRSVTEIRSLGNHYVPRVDLLTSDEVEVLRAAGVKVYAWNLVDRADYDRVRDLGIEGAIVNDPAATRAIWG